MKKLKTIDNTQLLHNIAKVEGFVRELANDDFGNRPHVLELKAAREFLQRSVQILRNAGHVAADDLQIELANLEAEIAEIEGA